MIIPPFIELLAGAKAYGRRPTDDVDKDGMVRFVEGGGGICDRFRFVDDDGRAVCEGELVPPINAVGGVTPAIHAGRAWAQWSRSRGAPLFCAVCLVETDEVTPQPLGRGNRLVNACRTCTGEHPRLGRYSFADGLKQEHVVAGAGSRRKGKVR
jgi:hypothetical protein